MAWSVCPACRAVVDAAPEHAAVCSTYAVLTSGTTERLTEGVHWPEGLEVDTPVLVDAADVDWLLAARAYVAGRLADIAQGAAAMDNYLTLTTPTQADVVAQVRILTIAARESLDVLDRLIRYTARNFGGSQ